MTILYTQLYDTNTSKILSNTFSQHGQSTQTNQQLLKELRQTILETPKTTKTYSYNSTNKTNKFYIKQLNNYFLAIITDSHTTGVVAQEFISQAVKYLEERHPRDKTGFLQFERWLETVYRDFNSDSRYLEAQVELTETRDVCIESLNKIIQRGEVIEQLGSLADELKTASQALRSRSRRYYYEEKMREYAVWGIALLVVFLILYFLLF